MDFSAWKRWKRNYMEWEPRRYGLAALLVVAAGVLYLSVTAKASICGDDCLNLNVWRYSLEHTPFWSLVVQDIRERFSYFQLHSARFFPFHYPSPFSWLFFGNMTSYRLYIIAFTYADALLLGRLTVRITGSKKLALAELAILPLLLNLCHNEGMLAYFAVVQKCLLWFLLAVLCLFRWKDTSHTRWAFLAGLLVFVCCGTYELGFIFSVGVAFLELLRKKSFPKTLYRISPVIAGAAVAFGFNIACRLANRNGIYSGVHIAFNLKEFFRVWVQQMWAAVPLNNLLANGTSMGPLRVSDVVLSLVLAALFTAVLFGGKPAAQPLPVWQLFVAGAVLLAGPAAMIAMSSKYQAEGEISWKAGYIPAAVESIGVALITVALAAWLVRRFWGRLQPRTKELVWLVLLLLLTVCGTYQRAAARNRHTPFGESYRLMYQSIQYGIADDATSEDVIVCDYNAWNGGDLAESYLFRRFTGRELQAVYRPAWDGTREVSGNIYVCGEYGNYGGYDLVWFGRAQDETLALMDDMRVYVDGRVVPDFAVLKYKVQAADGSIEERAVPLLELSQSPRNKAGGYVVSVPEENILAEKIMIWDG